MRPDYTGLKLALRKIISGDCLIDDPLRLHACGTDASFYRLVPRLVVKVSSEEQVSALLRLANKFHTPVTFRAAGTSLSGQAITDSVLVMLDGKAWRDYEILDAGDTIRLQPGIIGTQANSYLARYGRKIGPDPASIASCKIGGIAANNASGMCCGVAQNSYQTLKSMRLVLHDGSVLDTADNASRKAFTDTHSHIVEGLKSLREQTHNNPALVERIRHKYKIKNTTGYCLNALIDYSDPIDVLQHLLIGSEGTLGFISEITYETVPEYTDKASALIFFDNVTQACEAAMLLKDQPVDAVEIMDRAALRSIEHQPGAPDTVRGLPDTATALLIETRAVSAIDLLINIDQLEKVLRTTASLHEIDFTTRHVEYTALWNIRKGLFPSIGAARATRTTVVIEDIAFPMSSLADGTYALQALFATHGYHNAIIFGHALEGNLHFVITPDFSIDDEVRRYETFMDELCQTVVNQFGGSLKAEHGTGRNIAPFVELEWGKDAYRLMQQIKNLLDPHGLLNPGVILNNNKQIHIQNLKTLNSVDPLIDRCIECGFCEPICPSRNYTLTPRQRIVAIRERMRRQLAGENPRVTLPDFDWQTIDTCAADGLCASSCPLGIDTGEMVKLLRTQSTSQQGNRIAAWAARHIGTISKVVRSVLWLTHFLSQLFGTQNIERTSALFTRISAGKVPQWHRWMPRAPKRTTIKSPGAPTTTPTNPLQVVYFSSCVNRSMGTASCDRDSQDLPDAIHSILRKAGADVVIPESIENLCCGMPFASKGYEESADSSLRQLQEELCDISQQGKLPVLCDTGPCSARLLKLRERGIEVLDTVAFIDKYLLPRLKQVKRLDKVALHITCSARKMGLSETLERLAARCADQVIQAEEKGCCGFAGDKGFIVPMLNASALTNLEAQIPRDCTQGYSNSRSCEVGLSKHSGIPYRSIAHLIDECFDSAITDCRQPAARNRN